MTWIMLAALQLAYANAGNVTVSAGPSTAYVLVLRGCPPLRKGALIETDCRFVDIYAPRGGRLLVTVDRADGSVIRP